MFREVGLHECERDFHRYLTKGEDNQLEEWRMKRLTFGVTSSPFLATQVLHQVVTYHYSVFPWAATVIKSTFYVDDCLTSADIVEEARVIHEELNSLLPKAKMTLRKWMSNFQELLESIPQELKETECVQLISPPEECHKALGIHWDTGKDTFHIATPVLDDRVVPTKRQIASDMLPGRLISWGAQ